MPKKVKLKLMKRHFFTIFFLFFIFYFLLPGIAVFALESGQIPGEAVSAGENSVVSGKTISVNFTCEKFNYPWCNSAESGVSGLIGHFYQIALALVGVTAFGVIVFAGITYTLSAGNSSKQKDSIDWITSASLGIVLLLGAYLLLWTINPNLVNLTEPNIEAVKIAPVAISTDKEIERNTFYFPTDMQYSHQEAFSMLKDSGIKVKSTSGKLGCMQSDCTSLNGLPKFAAEQIINIKEKSGANIVITGGTESGHETHGPGKPIVDIGYADGGKKLENYIIDNTKSINTHPFNQNWKVYHMKDGTVVTKEVNPDETHWHINFAPIPGSIYKY